MKFDFAMWFVLVMLVVGLLVAVNGSAPPFILTTTKYAPGYTGAAFHRVKLGDSTNAVFRAIGRPLSETRYDNGQSRWRYTGGSWTPWSQRRILWFSNDVVTSKISDVYDN